MTIPSDEKRMKKEEQIIIKIMTIPLDEKK
jgi:hypothetical protein